MVPVVTYVIIPEQQPLLLAVKHGLLAPDPISEKIAELLILPSFPAYIDRQDQYGNSALLSAVRGGSLNLVKLLLEAGANVNQVDTEGNTPIALAVLNNRHSISATLLKHGANLSFRDSKLNTLLHLAVEASRNNNGTISEITTTLLKNKEKLCINALNTNKETALMIARRKNHIKLCNKLVEYGANSDHLAIIKNYSQEDHYIGESLSSK